MSEAGVSSGGSVAPPVTSGAVPLVRIRGLVKRFGSFTANDHVDLDLYSGEGHALIGENGAGKSTLVKILYGLLQPTEGTIEWKGERIAFRTPNDARSRGIGMVFQHFSLFDNLTVAENVALVMPPDVTMSGLEDRIRGLEARYGLALEPGRPVWRLSAGERQRIEIARCLLQNPDLVILDEPTSVLTPQEADGLFLTLDRLKSEGKALLYISHRLEEITRLCERATILRLGKMVGTCDPKKESARSMAALMVGVQVKEIEAKQKTAGPERFSVRGLTVASPDMHGTSLTNIDLAVRGGEILGIAGVAGNGQPELFAALSGETACQLANAIIIDGTAVGTEGINARRQRNAAFVPEERNGHAAAPDFSLSENAVLSRHATGGLARAGFILEAAARAVSSLIISTFDVRRAGPDPLARTLCERHQGEAKRVQVFGAVHRPCPGQAQDALAVDFRSERNGVGRACGEQGRAQRNWHDGQRPAAIFQRERPEKVAERHALGRGEPEPAGAAVLCHDAAPAQANQQQAARHLPQVDRLHMPPRVDHRQSGQRHQPAKQAEHRLLGSAIDQADPCRDLVRAVEQMLDLPFHPAVDVGGIGPGRLRGREHEPPEATCAAAVEKRPRAGQIEARGTVLAGGIGPVVGEVDERLGRCRPVEHRRVGQRLPQLPWDVAGAGRAPSGRCGSAR